jgi:phosphoribosylformylglycinamidine cyclo-ligase
MSSTPSKAYARAGVDVDLANQVVKGIGSLVKGTHGPRVLGRIGGFGGLFSAGFPEMTQPVLCSSIDGVGTKLKVAHMAGQHGTIGIDLVNHCVNDIAVLGAKPLFFMDYIGTGKLTQSIFEEIIGGLAKGCKEAGCALIGGETAEMPGVYQGTEYDLVGAIVGIVDHSKIIDGSTIIPGDVILGLPSNGLHTNGYSLARRIILEERGLDVHAPLPGHPEGHTVAQELLRTHINYQPRLSALPPGLVKGLAHITGGGLLDNLPRVFPDGVAAQIKLGTWTPEPIFQFLVQAGNLTKEDAYQTFNMGIGMAIVTSFDNAPKLKQLLPDAIEIGRMVPGHGDVTLI